MTPAIELLNKTTTSYKTHEYRHDKDCTDYGLEAVANLAVSADVVFKTLIVRLNDQRLVVAILPVSKRLNMKRVAQALGVKKAEMAGVDLAQKSSGYLLGAVSPLAQKRPLQTLIDSSAKEFATLYVSAGKRGLEISLSPKDLASLTNAQFISLCQ